MFVPLSHAPGHSQCDFGEAVAVIGGVERKVHYFVLDLPHSDGCFVKAYPAETTEAFLDGHLSASHFWVGCPRGSCTTIRSWRWPGYWAMVEARLYAKFRGSNRCHHVGKPPLVAGVGRFFTIRCQR